MTPLMAAMVAASWLALTSALFFWIRKVQLSRRHVAARVNVASGHFAFRRHPIL